MSLHARSRPPELVCVVTINEGFNDEALITDASHPKTASGIPYFSQTGDVHVYTHAK